jgi:hypothetical protein
VIYSYNNRDIVLRPGTGQTHVLGGNVGIGTSDPQSKLSVEADSDAFLYLMRVENTNSGAHAASAITVRSDGNLSTTIGRLGTTSSYWSGYGQPGESFIYNGSSGNGLNIIVPDASNGKLNFFVGTNATGIPKMTIDGTGNIGIGTSAPQKKLHIAGSGIVLDNAGEDFSIYGASDDVEHNHYLKLLNSSGLGSAWGLKAGGILVAHSYSYANPAKDNLIVEGNIGVGTPNPTAKLHVVGDLCVTGQKNAIVPTSKGMTKVYSEESAEVWFTDYGRAKLASGKCHVDLDPLFLETVTINDKNQMMVFLQEEDECSGLVVKPGTTGFDVFEKGSGKSNAQFSYRIVAKRKGQEKERLASAGGGK